jgi:hypothetical protein
MDEFERLKRQVGNTVFHTKTRKVANKLKWGHRELKAFSSQSKTGKWRTIPAKSFIDIAAYARGEGKYRKWGQVFSWHLGQKQSSVTGVLPGSICTDDSSTILRRSGIGWCPRFGNVWQGAGNRQHMAGVLS